MIRKNDTTTKTYKKNVCYVTDFIDDYDGLKTAFHKYLYPYIAEQQRKQDSVDNDIKKEFIA